MATIDAFQGAEGSADAQRRALLTAIAQQGSAGRTAVAESQKAAQAAHAASVSGAAQRAGALGTTAGMGVGASSAGAYRANSAGVSQMLQADQARQASANDNYMGQVQAAIPVLRTLAESRQADMLKETKDRQWEEANRRKWELQDRQKQREDEDLARRWLWEDRQYEMTQREKEAAAEAEGNPLARLVDALGGQTLAKTQLSNLSKRAIERAEQEKKDGAWKGAGFWDRFNKPQQIVDSGRLTAADRQAALDQIGKELGLDEGLLDAFLGKSSPAAEAGDGKPSAETVERVRNKPEYQEWMDEALTAVEEFRAEGLTQGEARARVAANMRSQSYLRSHPVLRDLIIKDALGG